MNVKLLKSFAVMLLVSAWIASVVMFLITPDIVGMILTFSPGIVFCIFWICYATYKWIIWVKE